MHNYNFFGIFPYSLGRYLPPPKRIRIISVIVFRTAHSHTPHTTHHTDTQLIFIREDTDILCDNGNVLSIKYYISKHHSTYYLNII